ncbi:EAL domain-containing protein [Roseicyclus salinarum]|uniref:EAL domain-containing protein n=1 Tax=Roseicyclus salinarum TaxID=3036773 RepID=UPI0024151B61|nr:EAL domain-containing protein [Roseibacterium sp. SDUM158017]
MGSPLEVAVAERDRGTLAMVERALARGDAVLAYQPVVRADGTGVAFYEGLIRIFDETGRIIPAGDFMAAVEERDVGRRIDCASLLAGLRALRDDPGLRLSINMSARSVGYPKWMDILHRFVRRHPEAIERLILEITETSVMQMPEIVQVFMRDLQDKGVTFALDDFGAGYTAFRHLKQFCFDILKIDGQFSRAVHEDADNQVLTEALISLARHFDMLVVSEAVETRGEAEWLTRAGVDCMQGYYFAAPSLSQPRVAEGDGERKMRQA